MHLVETRYNTNRNTEYIQKTDKITNSEYIEGATKLQSPIITELSQTFDASNCALSVTSHSSLRSLKLVESFPIEQSASDR